MSSSLGARLSAERNHRFVGRVQELELFRNAITSSVLPFNILYIYGPGGIGKTSLLRQLTRIAEQRNIQFIYIEGRNLEPAPASFLSVLRSLLNLQDTDSPLQILGESSDRTIVFLDTYENISALDEWLREEFLPQLSSETLVVFSGRNSPSEAWCSDPGWQALIRTLPLRNLSPEESLSYLTKRDIPIAQHSSILDFTHGYPLALSLIADVFIQEKEIFLYPETVPDIIKALLERFITEVPTPSHRLALQACAVVRLMTEALLSHMLDLSDTHEVFEWLRELSFIEAGQMGVFPHDLAREVLIADLRWRNPELYAELHHRSRAYYVKRLEQTQDQEKHRILFDYMFLHRDNPAIRPRFTWQEQSSLLTDSLTESDKDAIYQMVAQYEGEESAKIAAHWIKRQPQNVVLFRDSESTPAGFAILVALHEASSEDLNADPGAATSWRYLQTHAPLRPSEGATIFRFWMARDTYQSVSPTQSLIFINFVQFFQKTPGLAYTFLPCAEPDAWTPMLTYFDLTRIPEADFEVGGRRYGVYGHDWRVVTALLWRELLAKREIAASTSTSTECSVTAPVCHSLLVLSQPDFVEAVQDALRNLTRPDALQKNPLLRSRLVEDSLTHKGSNTERITALITLVKQAAESLQSFPRDEKLYRVLYRTYVSPAPTQEQAAEQLDLPFSTYRRHLKAGITRVADLLWQREIN
ncbi:AAA family ATPase [Scytonema sp. NUACC26]|uniref:AAA family ATPase n=1 Tax=Scytonema sp. NUACC26 TaxID=3140176 RepID=UPI0034DC759C